ncbi:MAG: DsrE family protein [Desulfosporosinus sp.]|nr:DsrE family protein [Desulfosporosinus sp.]
MDKYKVVFHIDEQDKAELLYHNISNLIKDIGGENLEIEVVANSDAVKVFLRSTDKFEAMFKELAQKQVVFCACANAMRNLGIQKDELFDFMTVVSAGVGELVKRQAAGWAYIRP